MASEFHVWYHEHILSNVTNWQHFGEGSAEEILVEIFASLLSQNSLFICDVVFSSQNKIQNFRQRIQHLLLVRNTTPKLCCLEFLAVTSGKDRNPKIYVCWGSVVEKAQTARGSSAFGWKLGGERHFENRKRVSFSKICQIRQEIVLKLSLIEAEIQRL